jgi:hypothetical protein
VYMYLREHGDEYPDIIEVDLNSLWDVTSGLDSQWLGEGVRA